MDLSFILNELGEEREDYFRAVSPPTIATPKRRAAAAMSSNACCNAAAR